MSENKRFQGQLAMDHLTTEVAQARLNSETRAFSNAMAKVNLQNASHAFTAAKNNQTQSSVSNSQKKGE